MNSVQLSYSQNGLPFLPVKLISEVRSIGVSALVDSGSTVNVLPYNVGIELGKPEIFYFRIDRNPK